MGPYKEGQIRWQMRWAVCTYEFYHAWVLLKSMFIQVSDSASLMCTEAWKMGISSIFAKIDDFQSFKTRISPSVHPDTSNLISKFEQGW